MSEEFTCTPISGLYFVYNHQSTCRGAKFAHRLQETDIGHLYTTDSLYTFDNHSSISTGLQLAFQCLPIVQSNKSHLMTSVQGCLNGRIIRHRHRHTRPTVKRSSHSQYFGPVCNERGQLQRIFVRFGSTIAKE